MLTSTGFCDQLLLTHVFGKQRESDAMIEPMSAGVVEILAFDEDLRSTHLRGQPDTCQAPSAAVGSEPIERLLRRTEFAGARSEADADSGRVTFEVAVLRIS
jgi:hypothetical protein